MEKERGSKLPESFAREVPMIVEKIKKEVSKIVIGQTEIVEHVIRAILCNGHILMEGVPGIAKTLIIRAVAKTCGCDTKRVQFTVDLLPSDILGINAYNPSERTFHLRKGPVFTNFLLADEINRSPPKTQSALLQAMQEREVAIGNEIHKIKSPFLVLATQNPIEQSGVYNLPEAEIDRFLFKINISYPKVDEEMKVLDTNISLYNFEKFNLKRVIKREQILYLQEQVKKVFSSREIKAYIVKLVNLTRDPTKSYSKYVQIGSSPRGSIALHIASKAEALMKGRTHVLPEDVNSVIKTVLRHRILLNYKADADNVTTDKIIDEILNQLSPA